MRLEKLQVSGFGHLHGVDVELQGPVTVLYGPNEAGKSTLLGFVRAILFGIPSRASGHLRYEPTQGSIHGGMLTIEGADGALWSIERYAGHAEGRALSGTRGDRLRITKSDLDGRLQELTQQEMQRELLGGMSKEMFKQLFAVSLSELQEVSALQSEEMSRFLFHAGIGGGAAVLRGEKKLAQEMDKLYKPRGRNQEMAQMLQSLDRLRQETDAAKALLPRYNEVLVELEDVEAERAKCTLERTLSLHEANKLEKAAEIRTDWFKREALLTELKALPLHRGFPEQGLIRWETLQGEKERLLLEIQETNRRCEVLHSEMASLILNQDILDQSGELITLASLMPGYESRVKQIAELESEALTLRGQLAQCLRSIDPVWRVEDLQNFAGTVSERENVRRYISRFAEYDKVMERMHSERFKQEREITSLKSAYTSAVSRMEESKLNGLHQFDVLIPQDRAEIRSLWSETKLELDRWREISMSKLLDSRTTAAEALAQDRMRSLYYRLLGGGAVLTVVLPAGLWMTTGELWNAAIGGGLMILFDLFLWLGFKSGRAKGKNPSRRNGHTGNVSPAEARLSTLLSKLMRHPLTAAGKDMSSVSSMNPEDWDLEERQLRQLMEGWYLWDQRHEVLEAEVLNCRSRAAAAMDELQNLERELSRREAAFDDLVQEWESWLSERKLPRDLSPEAALEVFRLTEQGGELLSRIEGLSYKISGLQKENEDFKERCRSLCETPEGAARTSVISQLQKMLLELEAQQEIKSRRDILAIQLPPLEEERGRLEDRLGRVLTLEGNLLAEAHAEEGEDYLRRGAIAARRETLEKEIRQCDLVMFGGLDDERKQQLELLLQNLSGEELSRQVKEARETTEETERNWQNLQEQRGRLLQEQDSLEARCKQEDLSQRFAENKAALSESIDNYAVMAVCNELISRVRRIYEEERQPEVLRMASGYFAEMTGGVYRRIVLKMGSQELMAEHREHGAIESTYLSRGSAEQLYLAMRLALSEAVSGHAKLPILLDDLFVNFDASRMGGAISVLKEVSNRHQIIMMTCHKHVVDEIMARIPGSQIVQL
ncbi:uncharacterized protein YhaN [Paenibacillus anaericanus]|uniref:AAA family ATPase n=1 Tax=Paenibacillus anaericanus TaxID=170367 RepID=UPI0027892431|nr:AAA family ATPase [Paenibacillus anaericanus]MDQ0086755.1 uncharacterized protein YhaN [Paenibacillus anaericanus]